MTKIARIAASTGLIAAMAIGTASAALADDGGQRLGQPGPQAQQGHDRGQHLGRGMGHDHGGMRGGPLADLVAKGTITAAQADAVKAALQASHDANEATEQADHEAAEAAALAPLVKAGTITQVQADAVVSADRGGLRDLVAKGTITKDQAMTIIAALRTAHEAQRADMQAEHKAEREAAIAGLVKAGTITQAQADAIIAAMPDGPGMHLGRGGHGGHGQGDRARNAPA